MFYEITGPVNKKVTRSYIAISLVLVNSIGLDYCSKAQVSSTHISKPLLCPLIASI